MCQRFSLTAGLPELVEQFRVGHVPMSYTPRYNISPTQMVPVLYEYRKTRILDGHRWGFMPYWSKDAVNADGRAISSRPIFRRIVNKQRCVIPCDGFYGWKTERKVHQPIRFVLKDRRTFGIPGFYERWSRVDGEELRAFTMLTTAPNRLVEGYADRMPAVLDEEGIDAWLSESAVEYRQVYHHVRELQAERMDMYPVGGFVNDLNLESPECADPIASAYAVLRR